MLDNKHDWNTKKKMCETERNGAAENTVNGDKITGI